MKKVVDLLRNSYNNKDVGYENLTGADMDKPKDKEIRIAFQIHALLYKRWKATGVGIRAQIAELVEACPKYKPYREAVK